MKIHKQLGCFKGFRVHLRDENYEFDAEIESGSLLSDSDRDFGSLEFYLAWVGYVCVAFGENMLIVDLNLAKGAYCGVLFCH